MDDLRKHLGSALLAARTANGWTQAETANEAGMAPEAYGRIERGHLLPRADTLRALATALDVSADELLGLAEPEPRDPPQLRRLVRRIRRLKPDAWAALEDLLRSLS